MKHKGSHLFTPFESGQSGIQRNGVRDAELSEAIAVDRDFVWSLVSEATTAARA